MKADPLRPAREAVERRALRHASYDRLMVFGSGLIEEIAQARADDLRGRKKTTLFLRVERQPHGPVVTLRDASGAAPQSLSFDLDRRGPRDDLETLLHTLTIGRIEIMQPQIVPVALLDLLQGLGARMEAHIVDAGLACPRGTLVQTDGKFCAGFGTGEVCAGCVPLCGVSLQQLADWRASQRLLTQARATADDDEAAAFVRVLTSGVLPTKKPARAKAGRVAAQSARIGLVVQGRTADEFRLIRDLLRHAVQTAPGQAFVVIGTTLDDLGLMASGNVFVSGALGWRRHGRGSRPLWNRPRVSAVATAAVRASGFCRGQGIAAADGLFRLVVRHATSAPQRSCDRSALRCGRGVRRARELGRLRRMTKLVSLHAHGRAASAPPAARRAVARSRRTRLTARQPFTLRKVFCVPPSGLRARGCSRAMSWTLTDLTRRHVVQLFVDGVALQICVADQYDDALASDGIGDGCYGFSFAVAADALADATLVEARLANLGAPVGPPVRLLDSSGESHDLPASRGVRWIGGLRFCGWLEAGEHTPTVSALIDGTTITEVSATTWHQIGGRDDDAQAAPPSTFICRRASPMGASARCGSSTRPGRIFPAARSRLLRLRTALSARLPALGHVDSERLRGELYDRLIPASLPMAQFSAWRERFAAPVAETQPALAVAVVFAGQGDEEASIASLEAQSVEGWVAATLPGTTNTATFDPDELESFVGEQSPDCDVIVFAPCGTVFEPDAVVRLAAALQDNPKAGVVYADLALRGDDGVAWPLLSSGLRL